jgi:glycosyltransferase involved in cell wall biosynthesis
MKIINVDHKNYKIALLVNQLTPYRLPIYQLIGSQFKMAIFYGGVESNRAFWDNLDKQLKDIFVKRSWGIQFRFLKGKKNNTYDYKFIHINPGYFLDLLSYKPDAIITVEMGFRTLIALVYGTIFRKPVWVWSGVTLQSEQGIKVTRKILRWLISRWAKHWISYGEAATEYLLSLGIKEKRILQIQNCVNEQLFIKPTEAMMNLKPKPVLLYVGQLIGRKGVDKLLYAAAKLQQEGYFFSILLIGGGGEEKSLKSLAKDLKLENIHFYPSQPPDTMPAIYRSADCLIFPTLEDIWGLVVNEALWSGIPVISSKYAGCARELLPQENIFDPLDENSFINALKRVLQGRISPPDTSPMKLHKDVAQLIIDDIQRVLENNENN